MTRVNNKIVILAIIRKNLKIGSRILGILLMLFMTFVLVLSIPFVQSSLGNYLTKQLNKTYNTHIDIDKVSLQFNGDLELKSIYIEDYKKDTLISIEELNTSVINISNLIHGKLQFGDIDINNLLFHIKTYKGATQTNLNIFAKKFESVKSKTRQSPFFLSSSGLSINQSVFKLTNENKQFQKILDFENLAIEATDFLINGTDVSVKINAFQANDTRGLQIQNMMVDFAYSLSEMTFSSLEIQTEKSFLNGDLKFSYQRKDLKHFTDKVNLFASLKDSSIFFDELNVFYKEFGSGQKAMLNVDLSGTLNNLQLHNLELTTNTDTKIYGDLYFKNLFKKEATNFFMRGNFSNLTSTYSNLKAFMPNILGKTIPSSFDRLGKFVISGNSQVNASTILADMTIDTDIGFIDTNLKIDKVNDIDSARYQGDIRFKTFDFGTFLNNPKIGLGSLSFKINGKGFIAKTLDTQVKGDVFEMEYNNYNYQHTKVSGTVKNKIFDGSLITQDPNLSLNFNGLIDFSNVIKKYDFEAQIDYANLNQLNFVKKDSISIFSSQVKMNLNSSRFDDAIGKITFQNTSYQNQKDTYNFESFQLTSRFEDSLRHITFDSPDIIEGELKGRFVFKDVKKLFENAVGHIYTNHTPHKVEENQHIDFDFKIYNKIITAIFPEVELTKNMSISGNVTSQKEQFKLRFESPGITYLQNHASHISLQIDNSHPLSNTYLEMDSLQTKYYHVSDFSLVNATVNDTLVMRSNFNGGKKHQDTYDLNFYHTINTNNELVIGFNKSDVTIKNKKWTINESDDEFHKISFNKNQTQYNIDKFEATHKNEKIQLSGFLRDSTQKDIKLQFTNVDLQKISPNINKLSLAGNVNGKLDISQKNGDYLPNSTIFIDDFKVNDFPLGSFDATITGNETLTNYAIKVSIKDDISERFSAKGGIDVSRNLSNIDVLLNFNNFNLAPLNPFLEGVLNRIRGDATGVVHVVGDIKKPEINGDLNLNNAGLGIPYLNVDYEFNNKASVTLQDQNFIFNDITITDTKFESNARLNGLISHVNFSKWSLGLDIKASRLLILDTKESEESLYYGTGFIGGNASLKGPAEALVIEVEAETKKGTVFKIPLSDAESFGDNSYMHFITKQEKASKKEGSQLLLQEVKGLEMDFDLDVTEDAEVEIIIDKNTGHSLKGRGRGGLLVEINTNGKFDMWGDFAVFEGIYNFAYGGIIQKEFSVEPGGTIAWEGDPLKARINMLTIYKTQANPSPLLDNPINRSIPVELNIALTGDLEQPNPEFSFDFPNVSSSIKSELQYRLESEEDRQNQALYLISTAAFSRGLDEVNFSGTIAERLNGIINGIFTNDDSKLNIGINYEAGQNRPDYQTDDRFIASIQTQISDRVLINGNVGVPVGGATETVIAGDVEISFLLNQEGTLTAKVFNRENSIQNFGQRIGYTQGLGLSYNVDFNTFKELIQKLFSITEDPSKMDLNGIDKNESDEIPSDINFKTITKQ